MPGIRRLCGFITLVLFTVALEHGLEQRNCEVLSGIFLNDEENDSLALQS